MVRNLHKARSLSGSPVAITDLKLGEELEFPSIFGGVARYRCTLLTDEKAVYSLDVGPDWDCYVVEFHVDDLSCDEFKLLPDIVKNYADLNIRKDPIVDVARKADGLGYVRILSFTQIEWTLLGVEAYKRCIAS